MLIRDLQLSIVKHLAGDAFFNGTPPIGVIATCGLKDATGGSDPETAMRDAIQKSGVGVVVIPGRGKFIRHGTLHPSVDLSFTIRVFENRGINLTRGGTCITAEDIAFAAARLLWNHGPKHPDTGAPMTGGPLVLGEIDHGMFRDESSGNIIFYSEFTATVQASDVQRVVRSARGN